MDDAVEVADAEVVETDGSEASTAVVVHQARPVAKDRYITVSRTG